MKKSELKQLIKEIITKKQDLVLKQPIDKSQRILHKIDKMNKTADAFISYLNTIES